MEIHISNKQQENLISCPWPASGLMAAFDKNRLIAVARGWIYMTVAVHVWNLG